MECTFKSVTHKYLDGGTPGDIEYVSKSKNHHKCRLIK